MKALKDCLSFPSISTPSPFFFFNLVRVWVQQEEESFSFTQHGWLLCVLGHIKRVTKLTLNDNRLKPFTGCLIVKNRDLTSQWTSVSFVRAEGNKSGRRKVAVLVSSQVDRLEGQLS